MPQLMDLITQAMGGDTTRKIGGQLGLDENTTQSAIGAAVPLLLAALAKNSAQPEGAEALHGALSRDHDGSVLDNLSGLLGGDAQAGPGAGILRHVLGDREPVAQQALSKTTGLDTGQAGKLLLMLAPVVLGALGRQQRQSGLDASGLAGLLGGERQRLASTSPDLMGMATRLLDQDGDGSFLDDLGGMAGKLLGRK
jgi:hypothetical protein